MRFSTVAKRSAIAAGVATVIAGSVFFLVSVASASAPPPAQYQAVTSTITSAGMADPAHAAAGLSSRTARPLPASVSKGARRLRTQSSAAIARAASNGATADSSSMENGVSAALSHNFNGVSSLDSAVTNFGAEFEPPDQGLCVGNGFIVEPVNSAYSVYRENGHLVAGPFNVNDLFGEGPTEFTTDPRCFFDKATHTWFATIAFIATTPDGNFGNSAHTDLAVNTTGDPTKPWTVYHIDATDDGTNGTPSHPGCPCFGDQPRLGIDAHNIYISTDEFSINGPEFDGTQIYVLSKSELVGHASSPHVVHFESLMIDGDLAFGVQPAFTYGSADAEYFLNSLDPDGTGDHRLGVWAMTNLDVVRHGGIPTLSSTIIKSEAYSIPPAAVQKGSSSTLDSGDDRMQEVEYINGSVWGSLGTALTVHGSADPRAAAAWFEVHPRLQGKKIGGANIRAQGYMATRDTDLLYPSIAVNSHGVAGMVVTATGANLFPSAAYTTLRDDHHQFGPVHIAAFGTGPYDPNGTRWGDYSWATLDPDNGSFWMAIEYIPPKGSQTTDGRRNWGTRVFDVSANDF